MSDLNDVVNQLAALRGALTQMTPQAPAWGAPAPSTAMVPAFPAVSPAALQALQALLTQPDPAPAPVAGVDEELRKEVRNIAVQVQALATAMQMMATQLGALASTTRTRLETLAAASMTLAPKPLETRMREPLDEDVTNGPEQARP